MSEPCYLLNSGPPARVAPESLHDRNCEPTVLEELKDRDFSAGPHVETLEKSHGRIERRRYSVKDLSAAEWDGYAHLHGRQMAARGAGTYACCGQRSESPQTAIREARIGTPDSCGGPRRLQQAAANLVRFRPTRPANALTTLGTTQLGSALPSQAVEVELRPPP